MEKLEKENKQLKRILRIIMHWMDTHSFISCKFILEGSEAASSMSYTDMQELIRLLERVKEGEVKYVD